MISGYYTITVTASGYQTYVDQNVYLPEGGRIERNYTLQSLMAPLQALQAGNKASVENTIQILQDVKDQITTMDPAAFKTPEKQNALIVRYNAVIREVQEGRYGLALRKLHYGIVIRINGCNRLSRSDGNDWITDCDAQRSIYDSTEEVRELIARFDSN